MKNALRLTAAIVLTVCVVSLPLAAKNPDNPRSGQQGMRLLKAPADQMVAAIATGNTHGLAAFQTWVTSDWETDLWTTNLLWYDQEPIHFRAAFYTTKPVNLLVKFTVKDLSGAIVFADFGVFNYANGEFDLNSLEYIDDGPLPALTLTPGDYKLIVKFKQGTAVVGQTFWFTVSETPPPVAG